MTRSDRLDTEGVLANAAPLPAALLFAWLLNAANLWIVFGYLLQTNAHESGHTLVSWLSSRFAMMIPVGLTLTSLDQSFGTGFVVFGLLAALGAWGFVAKQTWAMAFAAGFLLLAIVLTFFTSAAKSLEWVVFGGCAGEIVLSALGVTSFYWTLPDRIRWDFWRYVVLVLSSCSLVFAHREWRMVAANPALLPVGSGLTGTNDSNGDMNKLLEAGWTAESIAGAYVTIANLAWLAIGVLYIYKLVVAVRRARA